MPYLMIMLYLPLSWLLYNSFHLLKNYQRASKFNLPMVVVAVSPTNNLWIAAQTVFSSVFRYIPFEAVSFTRHCRLGWEFHDRYKTHQRLGDAWVLVTPNQNWLYVGEAEAAVEIFSRNKDFGRPVWMLAALDVFGPNVSTAEGADWQRQRKLTATPFNEQNSTFVWAEAIRQAKDMLRWWKSHNVVGTSEDVRTLALHVLAYAGFQKSYAFKSAQEESGVQRPSTYRDSLSLILKNAFVIMIVPEKLFSIPFLPIKWTQLGWAKREFKGYMLEMLANEKKLVTEGKRGSGNLVSNLVRASDTTSTKVSYSNKDWSAGKYHEMKPLSVEEILGNIFVFNFAGHDTTAISLAYSVLLLVAHPEIQDWISEELQCVLPSENSDDWDYNEAFPKLQRCLAVLFETLRLYNPLPGVPKWTGPSNQTLKVNDITYLIPPETLVVPNLMTLHTHPRYWGSDSLVWRPSRWIQTPTTSSSVNPDITAQLSNERLLVPTRGSFIAWSDGARNCPGKKFAQVEFVAVMAVLFRNHRAEPVPRATETLFQARQRVLGVVKDSSVELLLQMRDPDSVIVRWSQSGMK